MFGNMMNKQLNVIQLLKHAASKYPENEIISREVCDGNIHRSNYLNVYQRSCQLANALNILGVKQGDRIATLAWNSYRHLELYYGVSGIGAVIHTINPRLFAEQIEYIINHAEDQYIFVDVGFLELLEPIITKLKTVKGIFLLSDSSQLSKTSSKLKALLNQNGISFLDYETFIADQGTAIDWPELDENIASSLCYTSGTTENPKGVLYSHRAAVLHSMAMISEEVLDIRKDSVILPMVAMYHASAWGVPYAAPIVGAKLVFPGKAMDPHTMIELIESEQVNLGLGVPTIWLNLHKYLIESSPEHKQTNLEAISSLNRICVGGAASPKGLVKTYLKEYEVYWQSLWGMTETGPLACCTPSAHELKTAGLDEKLEILTTAGRPVFGVEMEIFDEQMNGVQHDGVARGELGIKGPWILQEYFKQGSINQVSSNPMAKCANPLSQEALNHKLEEASVNQLNNNWLMTGDIATIDQNSFVRIVDRKKDVIKSGGEWISSIELEDIASEHPWVEEACALGVQHPKWDERPIVLVKLNELGNSKGSSASFVSERKCQAKDDIRESILTFYQDKIAKWWMPDDIVIVDELPHNGTGKLMKNELRQKYKDYLVENFGLKEDLELR